MQENFEEALQNVFYVFNIHLRCKKISKGDAIYNLTTGKKEGKGGGLGINNNCVNQSCNILTVFFSKENTEEVKNGFLFFKSDIKRILA